MQTTRANDALIHLHSAAHSPDGIIDVVNFRDAVHVAHDDALLVLLLGGRIVFETKGNGRRDDILVLNES